MSSNRALQKDKGLIRRRTPRQGCGQLTPADHNVKGIVEMMLKATLNYDKQPPEGDRWFKSSLGNQGAF